MAKRLFIIFSIILVASAAFKSPAGIFTVYKGSIAFRSDAPLELIQASSNELKGLLQTDTKQFAFSIKIKSFKGFNSALQKEHFNENYLESEKFPDATFSGKIIEDVDFANDNTTTVRAKGILTIHGVPQERIIKSDIIIKNGIISLNSNFTVLLADHNIPIPKVVHEKLASEIKVAINAELKAR